MVCLVYLQGRGPANAIAPPPTAYEIMLNILTNTVEYWCRIRSCAVEEVTLNM